MTDLAQTLNNAFRHDDLAEITVRVSRYEADLRTPAAYQAIAKYRTIPGGPWGVGVRVTASGAMLAALEDLAKVDILG